MESSVFFTAAGLGWVIDIVIFVSAVCILASADKNQRWEYKIYFRKLESLQKPLFLVLVSSIALILCTITEFTHIFT